MKLKRAILQVMDRDVLKRISDELGIEDVDRRSGPDMAAAISRKHRATPDFLLRLLSEAQVKDVCELVDVSAVGRRGELIKRLVTGEQADDGGQSAQINTKNDQERRSIADRGQKSKLANPSSNGANVGYEGQLWHMADALRGSMDAAEYKHVVLGLIFLKYISDAFEERHSYLSRAVDDPNDEYFLSAETRNRSDAVARLIEDPDEYRAQSIFWVPREARWAHLSAQAKQPSIGQLVDDAMAAIERDNPALKSVLPKDYARPALDKQRLGQPS